MLCPHTLYENEESRCSYEKLLPNVLMVTWQGILVILKTAIPDETPEGSTGETLDVLGPMGCSKNQRRECCLVQVHYPSELQFPHLES